MGKHYVPQHYLQGFCDYSNLSMIWMYEKGNDEIKLVSIENIANEKNLWPDETENQLTNEVENPANAVISKIRRKQAISIYDKKLLSTYISVMLLRVPRGLHRIKELAPVVLEDVVKKVKTDINYLIKLLPEKRDLLQQRLSELPLIKAKMEQEFPLNIWYKNLTADTLPQVQLILPQMRWVMLTSENKHAFITSDNPVFFFEGIGMGKMESQIFFPISSKIVLFLSWQNRYKADYLNVKETSIKEINKRITSSATRFIFHSRKNTGILSLINKKTLSFKKIV